MPRQVPRHTPAVRPAFTLAELMIVIGIMVLMLALAVPTFNAMTGSRSIENAQNIISSYLAQARLSAIGQQAPRGVVFYRDAASDRIAMAIVRVASRTEWPVGSQPTFDPLEIVAETDSQRLPSGVDIAFRHNDGASSYIYRMPSGSAAENLRGAVLFDAKGHVVYREYGIGDNSELERRTGANGHVHTQGGSAYPFYSQPAFLLAERSAVDNNASSDTALNTYLNENATVVLVNRYNGTLTRSE